MTDINDAERPAASFAGKAAFVTGAASGIGRAAALAFAHEGGSCVRIRGRSRRASPA